MKAIDLLFSCYKKYISCLTFFLLTVLIFNPCYAYNSLSWGSWVQQLKEEALAQGINPTLFDEVFTGLTPNTKVLHFDKTQPERRLTYMQYRNSRIDSYRIKLGRREFNRNADLLKRVGGSFGVDPCFIAALWGIETSYGHYMGTFPVIRALATLAYDSPRSDYFRKELLIALHILNDGHVSTDKFVGEWAGASGIPQFMPSSWQKYAVDYDGDGHKDIWSALPDAFASIANYLRMNGWQTGEPWGIQVTIPNAISDSMIGLAQQRPIYEWLKMGVTPIDQAQLPVDQNMTASVIRPDGGPDYMVFNNFRVVMKYNNSVFYAGSVSYLADRICGRIN